MKQLEVDVWQGTLALMVLKTLEALGPLHGYGICTEVPEARPARAPPPPLETEDQSQGAPEFDAAC
jgi:hypothetical protein